MSLRNKYGPFAPQELEKQVNWLETKGLSFELTKDQNLEQQFKRNDPSNILAVTEFRTEVYLAQIFYLEIDFPNLETQQQFERKFIQKSEVIPIWINKLTANVSQDISTEKHNQKKRLWASVLILLWLGYIVFSYFRE